jgi:hypothetical protein
VLFNNPQEAADYHYRSDLQAPTSDGTSIIIDGWVDDLYRPAQVAGAIRRGLDPCMFDIHSRQTWFPAEGINPIPLPEGTKQELFLDLTPHGPSGLYRWIGMERSKNGQFKLCGVIAENTAKFAANFRDGLMARAPEVGLSTHIRLQGKAPLWAYVVAVAVLKKLGYRKVGWTLPEGAVHSI